MHVHECLMHHSVLYRTRTSPAPTKAPTKAPVAPTEAPVVARRRRASEPDQYGNVAIYQYELDDNHHANIFLSIINRIDYDYYDRVNNGWGNNPQYLIGTVPGAEFGEEVAISEDGTTVDVGSPGLNTVQVFRLLFELSWQQVGIVITKFFS